MDIVISKQHVIFNLFPTWQTLDSSKLNMFVDNSFKFDKNGRQFSRWVENTVGKGENVCSEQFLLFPQFFLKDLYSRHVKTRACLGMG